eukprot:1969482-Amphidinium_carterae.1
MQRFCSSETPRRFPECSDGSIPFCKENMPPSTPVDEQSGAQTRDTRNVVDHVLSACSTRFHGPFPFPWATTPLDLSHNSYASDTPTPT